MDKFISFKTEGRARPPRHGEGEEEEEGDLTVSLAGMTGGGDILARMSGSLPLPPVHPVHPTLSTVHVQRRRRPSCSFSI